jgi:mono/diheme cytochrome c family protein
MHKYRRLALVALAAWEFVFVASSRAGEDPIAQFEQQVRPVLEKHCFECHGPDKQKGGLRLDLKQSMLAGGDSGEPAIVPGSGAESQLVKFITSSDPDEKMPPKGDRLPPEQIAALTHWIDLGAHWPGVATGSGAVATQALPADGLVITDRDRAFWSFQPPRRSQPVLTGDASWVRQPMDRFVLARLREKGLEPSPEASRAVFIRRVTFDLTGLPPTPEEVDAFLNDASPGAVERLVERLLGSPAFGEHMASLWLPLARFGEDQALQVGNDTKLFYPNAWQYRAWVIDAFNRDLPYDRFLELQLAADCLPGTPPTDLAALGFLGLGPKYYNRGRLDVMADEWEDRVDTVTRTMLGLTVACARCHDHKFDPISTRDYYALAGIFASTRMVNKTADGRVEKEADQEKVDPGTLHIVEDGAVQDLNVFIRGNVDRKRSAGGAALPRSIATGTGADIQEWQRPARTVRGHRQPAKSAASACLRQSRVGRDVWPFAGVHAEQLWAQRRAADEPAVARRSGGAFHERRMVDESAAA